MILSISRLSSLLHSCSALPERLCSLAVGMLLLATLLPPAWARSPAIATQSSIEQRVAAAIARIEATDSSYNAVIAIDPAAADAARTLDALQGSPGLLHGEPILLKDNIESIGLATTAGSLALAENFTNRDADLVARLRAAGAVILGKTNLSEWANFRSEHSISGWSAIGGQTRNAVDTARSPCGSSSGSAVAVALGYVDVAIGTETSGSIVCPAAVNGVVGFKPTQGLVSGSGIVPLALSQDTAGPIARTVTLAAHTLAAIADPTLEQASVIRDGLASLDRGATLSGVRIGVFASTLGYDQRRDAQLDHVLQGAREAGAVIVPDLQLDPYPDFGQDSYAVLLFEFRRDLNAYLGALPNALASLNLAGLIRFNEEHRERELRYFDQSIFMDALELDDDEESYRARHRASRIAMREEGLDKLFADNNLDALIGITEGPAWMIDNVNGDAWFGPGMARAPAIAGNPHITLPLGKVAGLPLGISLVGERWKDHRLAQLALLFESMR